MILFYRYRMAEGTFDQYSIEINDQMLLSAALTILKN
jgi:hypothetical protein